MCRVRGQVQNNGLWRNKGFCHDAGSVFILTLLPAASFSWSTVSSPVLGFKEGRLRNCSTYLSLPLPQHKIGRSRPRPRCRPATTRSSTPILRHLRITSSMINPIPNLRRILPYPVLRLLGPRGFELFLTYGTRRIAQSCIIGGTYPLLLRSWLFPAGFGCTVG